MISMVVIVVIVVLIVLMTTTITKPFHLPQPNDERYYLHLGMIHDDPLGMMRIGN